MKLFTALIVACIGLFGCATAATPLHLAKATPPSRVFYSPSPSDNQATVVFVRDTGFAGSAVFNHLSIDGQKAASIDVGETVTFSLPAGEYVFGVVPTDPFGSHATFFLDQKLMGGKEYLYRILTDGATLSTRIHRDIAPTSR